jgi:hypothetical protein
MRLGQPESPLPFTIQASPVEKIGWGPTAKEMTRLRQSVYLRFDIERTFHPFG